MYVCVGVCVGVSVCVGVGGWVGVCVGGCVRARMYVNIRACVSSCLRAVCLLCRVSVSDTGRCVYVCVGRGGEGGVEAGESRP